MERLWETIRYFFTSDMLNPHGICLLWRPELLWTHAVSDVIIGLAYFSIPLALGVFLYHRRDVRFGWVVWMFVAFIMLCGVTHFMMVWTLWNADYGIEALVKVATAIASMVTAIALWPLLPRVVALPSPAMLEARIAERDEALAQLRQAMDDMVAMEEHQRRQKLLLDELNHRVKNTLASVQAIAVQTLNRAEDLPSARDTFVSRLMALSRTHDLLVRTEWTGVRFHRLAADMLAPYGKRLSVEGLDLEVAPNTAVSLGMALHELATNAVKYGAWSHDGEVRLDTREDDGRILITWTERDGPPVAPPERQGFGSRLLERGVAAELGATVRLDFTPSGLICVVDVPVSDHIRPVTGES